MKLFIWNEPYAVNYGGSCLYVLANDLEEARRLAMTAQDASFGTTRDETRAIDVSNVEPTRVIDGPYAECYHWEE